MGRANSYIGEFTRPSLDEAVPTPRAQSVDGEPVRQPQTLGLGLLKGRYKNHPTCDLCTVRFDVTRRRHQCRRCGRFVCSSCIPGRLLVPWTEQFDDVPSYDKAIPQRVCEQCTPVLRPLQEELVALYAHAHEDNIHEAKERLHLPYTWSMAEECQHAADIIGNFFRDRWGASKDRAIPAAILQNAKGLAIMTILKAGFYPVCSKLGTGLVIRRMPDDTWSAPSAIGTFGAGPGVNVGGELTELVLILGSNEAVDMFLSPQINLGAGVDITAGPFGRSASLAVAASLGGVNANYSYSHSRGLFVGLSLEGAVIFSRKGINHKFYGQEVEPRELLNGNVAAPNAAQPLYEALDLAMQHAKLHAGDKQRASSTSTSTSNADPPGEAMFAI